MPSARALLRRLAFSSLVLYVVASATFAVVELTPNPNRAAVVRGVTGSPEFTRANDSERDRLVEEALAEYEASRALAGSGLEQYASYMAGLAQLDLGYSASQAAPVAEVLLRTAPFTLAYVVPAVGIAVVGGVGLGLFLGLRPGSAGGRAAAVASYLAYGLPNFWLAVAVPMLGAAYAPEQIAAIPAFRPVVLPAVLLGSSLFVAQLRYTRAESLEHAESAALKLVRAKGGGPVVAARHLLRIVAPTLASLFVVDLVGVLAVNVFILEEVLEIQGLGRVTIAAIRDRDAPLVVGAGLLVAVVGVVGNLLQDLVGLYLDPRVEEE